MNQGRRGGRAAVTATLTAAATVGALAATPPANAEVVDKHLAVDCPQPYSQKCIYSDGVKVQTDGPIYVKFTADGNPPACAPGRAIIRLNDGNVKEAVLQPGQSVDFVQMRGKQTVYAEIQMEGVLGGCNTGAMSGWSGHLHVETNGDALQHLPPQQRTSSPATTNPPTTAKPPPTAIPPGTTKPPPTTKPPAPGNVCNPNVDICVR